MSDSHWGTGGVRGPLIAVLGTVVIVAAAVAVFAWSPWEEPTEVEWLGAYETWSDAVDVGLSEGRTPFRAACEATFDDEVGNPPTERMQPTADAARGACADVSAAGWREAQAEVVRTLMAVHAEELPPMQREDIAEIVRSSVGVQPDVYCWQPPSWATFSEQFAIVRGGEETSLRGIADEARNRIDLDPGICATLDGYLDRVRPLKLSEDNLDLGEALVVLTHQAEHLKAPSASEADVECFAMQHVRPLVDAAGWGDEVTNEVALLQWEVAYPRLPGPFRSRACRDGGALDRNAGSNVWP